MVDVVVMLVIVVDLLDVLVVVDVEVLDVDQEGVVVVE